MQRKHLIAFTLATAFMLLGFNMINNYFHEKNRAAATASPAIVAENSTAEPSDDTVTTESLGEQPKAIIDNVTADIEQAQQTEQQRLEQMDNAQ